MFIFSYCCSHSLLNRFLRFYVLIFVAIFSRLESANLINDLFSFARFLRQPPSSLCVFTKGMCTKKNREFIKNKLFYVNIPFFLVPRSPLASNCRWFCFVYLAQPWVYLQKILSSFLFHASCSFLFGWLLIFFFINRSSFPFPTFKGTRQGRHELISRKRRNPIWIKRLWREKNREGMPGRENDGK